MPYYKPTQKISYALQYALRSDTPKLGDFEWVGTTLLQCIGQTQNFSLSRQIYLNEGKIVTKVRIMTKNVCLEQKIYHCMTILHKHQVPEL